MVEGDTHDIGKNLVKIMMETAGFEMHDLGRDVPAEEFVNQAEALKGTIGVHFHTDDDHNERYGRYHRTFERKRNPG